MDLTGKVAIVTGATRGIGRAIALGLAGAGCNIVVTGRTETPRRQLPGTIHSVAGEIAALGPKALPIACDVRDESSVQAMAQASLDKFGHIDILVNNAGIGSYAPSKLRSTHGSASSPPTSAAPSSAAKPSSPP